MKVILTYFFVLFAACSFAQVGNGNIEMIENIKTNKSKTEIEKLLIGHWEFIEMQTPEGKKIDTIFHKIPNGTTGKEIVERTNYFFLKTMSYATNSGIDNDTTNGTWMYRLPDKDVVLTFHEPVLPVDESMPEDYIKSLVEQGVIKPIEYSFFEIHKIDKNELWIIEHLPHSENELKYNLLYYKKK
tara:strand:+ start:6734 stop:7291 length:558 start_codon:yes stop_codon:yes gene_type:complete